MDNEKVMQIISVVIFIIGLICLGGVLYYIVWGWVDQWDQFYTWLAIIGLPFFIAGVVLVNKYLKSY
ncbi:MAG: hypothetical protein ACTSRG_07590 [Candidatus Helarchaeota archaeon]